MASIVYAAPVAPMPPRTQLRQRATHEWIGWDSSRWELSNWRSGVFLTQGGVEGLGMPSETAWIQPQSPVVHGQTYDGGVLDPRSVFWPVHLFSDGTSANWQQLDSDFWKTLRPGRYGTWRVTTSAGTRELRCRADDNSSVSYARDPHYFGWQAYGLALIADDPFWYATDPVSREWVQDAGENFYGGGAPEGISPGATPFVISKGSTLADARMDNPGDVDAWPVWRVTGPASNISLGVGGRFVSYPGAILEGQVLTINTDPMDQQAYLDGVNVTNSLGDYDFARIPAGADERLDLSMDGVGTVRATLHPRFYRAW